MAASGYSGQVRHALQAVESARTALDALVAARQLREAADALELAAVGELRDQGGTWREIGVVYGTTKQGAQQRFRDALARERLRGDRAPGYRSSKR